MKITILTLFPKMISGFIDESIIKRAVGKKLVELEIVNIRDFAIDKYGTVDDRPYGGGAGMVMRVDVVDRALEKVKTGKSKVILTTPKGKTYDQKKAMEYSRENHLVIIAGHYEGVDERVLEQVDEEISIGDFVMTGGEIAAAAIADSVIRLIPGVLKKEEATINETFNIGGKKLLEYPQYTRPEEYKGKRVPEVLIGGNHKDINQWRMEKAIEETRKKRPDLLA
ncbi:MAG: tRNA (guanosine(37)-N1)-methyltransferase TrmD [Patescibacteria group bacterium]